jgi:hypothetical protein
MPRGLRCRRRSTREKLRWFSDDRQRPAFPGPVAAGVLVRPVVATDMSLRSPCSAIPGTSAGRSTGAPRKIRDGRTPFCQPRADRHRTKAIPDHRRDAQRLPVGQPHVLRRARRTIRPKTGRGTQEPNGGCANADRVKRASPKFRRRQKLNEEKSLQIKGVQCPHARVRSLHLPSETWPRIWASNLFHFVPFVTFDGPNCAFHAPHMWRGIARRCAKAPR